MSEGPDEEERSIYLRLFLGLLPFDVDTAIEAIEDIRSEIDDTSWTSVTRRSANLGLLIGTIGLAASTILLYILTDFSDTPLQHVGSGYRLGFAVFAVLWISKLDLQFMQNIDSGDSPLDTEEQHPQFTSVLEFVTGVSVLSLVIIPLFQAWSLNTLLFMSIAVTAVGVTVAGVCLTLGGAYDFIAYSSNPDADTVSQQSDEPEKD